MADDGQRALLGRELAHAAKEALLAEELAELAEDLVAAGLQGRGQALGDHFHGVARGGAVVLPVPVDVLHAEEGLAHHRLAPLLVRQPREHFWSSIQDYA